MTDVLNEGENHQISNEMTMILSGGSVTLDVYATEETGPDEQGQEQTIYYNGAGEIVEAAEYENVKNAALHAAQSSGWLTLSWKDLSQMAGLSEDARMPKLLESYEEMDISNDV